jgi:hypothetical protein
MDTKFKLQVFKVFMDEKNSISSVERARLRVLLETHWGQKSEAKLNAIKVAHRGHNIEKFPELAATLTTPLFVLCEYYKHLNDVKNLTHFMSVRENFSPFVDQHHLKRLIHLHGQYQREVLFAQNNFFESKISDDEISRKLIPEGLCELGKDLFGGFIDHDSKAPHDESVRSICICNPTNKNSVDQLTRWWKSKM